MREKKLARQKALGLVTADQKLPEVSYFNNKKIMAGLQTGFEHNALPKWNDLPEKRQTGTALPTSDLQRAD